MPSVLWHLWLGVRKSIRPVKLTDEVLMWLSVWSEVHIVCIWSSWCRCIPKPHYLLPHLNPYWFYLSSTGIPRLSLKIDVVLAFIPQRTSYTFQRAMDRHMPPEVSLPDGDLVLHVRTCIDGSPCPRESAPKRHFDCFSCFGGILGRDHHTERRTTLLRLQQ